VNAAAAHWLDRRRRRNAELFPFDARRQPLAVLLQNRRTKRLHLIRAEAAHLRALASFSRLVD